MNSNFVNCPTCNTSLIPHIEAFEKMGIVDRRLGRNATMEPMIFSSTELNDPKSPVAKSVKRTQKYIADNKLSFCCVMRILGTTGIDAALSRIIKFGEEKKKPSNKGD